MPLGRREFGRAALTPAAQILMLMFCQGVGWGD
jgi:hypothetical protein